MPSVKKIVALLWLGLTLINGACVIEPKGQAEKEEEPESVPGATPPGPPPAIPSLDTTGPLITNLAPSGAQADGTFEIILTLNTNELAQCRYSENSIAEYDAMAPFSATSSTTHRETVTVIGGSTRTFYIICRDSFDNDSSKASTTVIIPVPSDSTAPVISQLSPNTSLPPGTTEVLMTLTTDEAANCRQQSSLPASFVTMSAMDFTGGFSHNFNITGLVDGMSYTYYVQCQDLSGNLSLQSSLSFTVLAAPPPTDVLGPLLSATGPNGNLPVGTTSTTLQTQTNENANCRYSVGPAVPGSFAVMTPFVTSGGTSHSSTIPGLSNGVSYMYFIQCEDTSVGMNLSSLVSVYFSVDAAAPVFLTLDDPLALNAWHLRNTGQPNFSSNGGTAGADLNLLATHTLGIYGTGIKIAVSDSGLENTHEDLADNIIPGAGRNYTSASPATWVSNPYPTTNAHGTAVSGIASAVGGNGMGSFGVAPNSGVAGFLFIDTTPSAAKDVDQATGDFDIFNYSYGFSQCQYVTVDASYITALENGVTTQRAGRGSLYVKSAGNDFATDSTICSASPARFTTTPFNAFFGNANLAEDAAHPFYIVTAALDANNVATSYSSPGSNVWISSYGGEFGVVNPAILTTDLSGCSLGLSQSTDPLNSFEYGHDDNTNCNYTSVMNGTSAAVPNVSGAIALILEANPTLTWRDVKHILASTAKKVDPDASSTGHPVTSMDLPGHTYQQGWVTNSAGYNFHNWYGFGGLDVDAARIMAENYSVSLGTYKDTLTGAVWDFDSGVISVSIPDYNAAGGISVINVTDDFVIEAVQIRLSVTHNYPSDLGVELRSPSGTKSLLLNINSNMYGTNLSDVLLLTNAYYFERSLGNWTLRVVDGHSGDAGTITNWKINIIGHDP